MQSGTTPSLLQRLSSLAGSRIVYASELSSVLQEGDVVIFSGYDLGARCIRCCTRSEYNHVALVVRRRNELVLFEATDFGVGVCPLEFYMNAYYYTRVRTALLNLPWAQLPRLLTGACRLMTSLPCQLSNMFKTVAIRPIYTKGGRGLTQEMKIELLKYYDEMFGRDFQSNPLEYILAWLNVQHTEDYTTVFCSELAAGAYKRMGLLPAFKGANTYLPRSFSERDGLRLLDGARLGRERRVVFERPPALSRGPSARMDLTAATMLSSSALIGAPLPAPVAVQPAQELDEPPPLANEPTERSYESNLSDSTERSDVASLGEGPSEYSSMSHGRSRRSARADLGSSARQRPLAEALPVVAGVANNAGARKAVASSHSPDRKSAATTAATTPASTPPSALLPSGSDAEALNNLVVHKLHSPPRPPRTSLVTVFASPVVSAIVPAGLGFLRSITPAEPPSAAPPAAEQWQSASSAPAPASATTVEQQEAERALLFHLLAMYTVRKWMRRVLRARQLRAADVGLSATAAAPPTALAAGHAHAGAEVDSALQHQQRPAAGALEAVVLLLPSSVKLVEPGTVERSVMRLPAAAASAYGYAHGE